MFARQFFPSMSWMFLFFHGFFFGFEFFAFAADALEELAGGFVGGVLGDELALEGFGEDGAIESI